MTTRERPTREIVVKSSPIELGYPIATPAMFTMTIMTLGANRIAPMVPFTSTDPLANAFVTIKAVSIGHAPKNVVALSTIVIVVIASMWGR